jgi:hypothetical protein
MNSTVKAWLPMPRMLGAEHLVVIHKVERPLLLADKSPRSIQGVSLAALIFETASGDFLVASFVIISHDGGYAFVMP